MLAEMNRISFLLLFIYRKIDWTKQRTSIAPQLQNFLSARRSFDLLNRLFVPSFFYFVSNTKGEIVL